MDLPPSEAELFRVQSRSLNQSLVRTAGALHRFLACHWFYPLLLCTVLGGAFLLFRALYRGDLGYALLVKNIVLAWIPYLLSLAAVALHQTATDTRRFRVAVVATWLAWLAMFPNAPYIFTDLIHWRHRFEMPWWFDLGLILMFSLAGCFCALASLRIMHDLVRDRAGAAGGWAFVLIVTLLSGFGIYLGRFLRWNSWDLLTHPHVILGQTFRGLLDPLDHARPIGVTLMFGTMLLACYVMFTSMTRAAATPAAAAAPTRERR